MQAKSASFMNSKSRADAAEAARTFLHSAFDQILARSKSEASQEKDKSLMTEIVHVRPEVDGLGCQI